MFKWLTAGVALAAMVSVARAEPAADMMTTKTRSMPSALVARPLVLGAGTIELATEGELSLDRGRNYSPVSIAPDLRYGLTDRLTVGLIHSNRAMGYEGRVGNGLCFAGEANGCPHLYDSTGVDGIYALGAGDGPWALALRGYAIFGGYSEMVPFGITAAGGVRARWRQGRVAVVVDPLVGVAYTDGGETQLQVQLLARAQYQLSRYFACYGGAGYYGPVDEAGSVPVFAGLLFAVDENIDVGASAAFTGVSDSLDGRSLDLTFVYRR